MASLTQDRLSKGDIVLVTGATGLIGSSIVDALIARGYKVRGVTRDVSKTQALKEKIDKLYGPGKVEFVQVDDGTKSGAFEEALQGTAGFIHTAIDVGGIFSPGAVLEKLIEETNKMTLGLLETSAKIPSFKAAVITSSNVAIYSPEYGVDIDVSLNDYNEKSVELAKSVPADHPARNGLIYFAIKTRSEQALWKWVDENKPSFSVNTVLPHMNFGRPFNPAPGVYSTSTWLSQVFDGDLNSPAITFLSPSNWPVDIRDCAIIHVAALLDRQTDKQRLWAAGNPPVHINDILKIWREAYPNYSDTIPADFDNPSPPKQTLNREASTALLQLYAGRDWIPLKETIINNVPGHVKA